MRKVIVGVLMMVAWTANVFAGHHFESDMAKKNPQLDLTDIFVFKSATAGKTVFIMGFNPQSKKDSLSNYSSKGIYRFCIGGDANFTKGISPTFTFKNNKVQFYLANEAEPALSTTGALVGEGPINRQLDFSNGIKVWTGTVFDLFQGNAFGIEAFKEKASKGVYDLTTFDIGEKGNVFANLMSTVIVLEIPNEMLPKNLFYYATTALEMGPNHWHRVNRIAHVLFPHLYLIDKEKMGKYMDSNHQIDEDVKAAIYANVLHYAKIAGYQANPEQYATALLKHIYPDVLTYAVGTDAEYTIGKINGRPLQADAMDVALALLVGSPNPIDDKVSIILERFQAVFPYVVPIDSDYLDAQDKVVKIEVTPEFRSDNTPVETDKGMSDKIWYVIGAIAIVLIVFLLTRKKKS